jgi:RHS repeat-associated protein
MRDESGVTSGSVSLPTGGGGISPLGDRFEPDLVRGSGNYAVPLQCPKGPNELRPQLALSYSTGAGNGPFGVGWRLNTGRIERASDRGVPRYDDADTFSIGDAETLVDVGSGRYRPCSDNRFASIERLDQSWRVRSGDGRTQLFGQTDASREGVGGRVFAWHLDQEFDAAGNRIDYRYRRDGARLYVEEIAWSIFRLTFVYASREDVLRNGRAGFLRTTALRLASIELHCDQRAPTLLRTYRLGYAAAGNGASLLTSISLDGIRDGERAAFPPLAFDYSALDFGAYRVHELQALIPPASLDDPETQLVDMTGDGLPDVLLSSASGMRLWRNSGDGWLAGPVRIDGIPSTVRFDRQNVALADLHGNGRADLFAVDQPLAVAFETDGRGGFAPEPIVFRNRPSLRLAAGDTRLMDVDGDGVADLIQTGASAFLLFRHEPGVGWSDPERVARVADLAQFPDVNFVDRDVVLADMTGDGLQDFVAVDSGRVVYWPYLGHGGWGAQVEMNAPPRFPDGFRRERLKVLDLDGDGCADIVYFDGDRTLIWINQCGMRFAEPIEIPVAPAGGRRILEADFFGDGRPGVAWSARRGRDDSAGYYLLRLDSGHAPYLLTSIDNGMGGTSTVVYSNTTTMRLADRADGRAWSGQLPFVVQVVAQISERESITGRTSVRAFRYHDGVFDGLRREFRGFASVTIDIAGDDSIRAARQELDYFQGDPEHPDLLERDRQRALAGALVATRVYERNGTGFALREDSTQQWDVRLEFQARAQSVHFPFLRAIETREHPRAAGTRLRIERTVYDRYDAFGNPGVRSRDSFADGDSPEHHIRSGERFTYTSNVADWIVKLPVSVIMHDGEGAAFAATVNYYDGAPFVGLPLGETGPGLLTRTEELRLVDARLPADYVAGRDFDALGYQHRAIDDAAGYYATTFSVRRDVHGNLVEQRDPLGESLAIDYDADGVFPIRSTDALGRTASTTFDASAGAPSHVEFADGRLVRFAYDAVGRLRASYESDDAGNEQLVKCWLLDLAARPVRLISITPETPGRRADEFALDDTFETLADVGVSCAYYDGSGQAVLQVSRAADGPLGEVRFMTAKRQVLNARALPCVEFAPRFAATLAYTDAPAIDASATRLRYDSLGRREETAGPGDVHHRVVRDTFSITHFEAGAAGALNASPPPGPPCRIEHFDARGRLSRIQEAKGDGTFVSTTYDLTLDGRIENAHDDAGGIFAHYVFGGPGEMIRIESREAGTRTYYRDAAGRSRECIHADGSRLFYRFDVLGRITALESARSSSDVRTTLREILYDADPDRPVDGLFLEGRVAVIHEADCTLRYAYNRAGKVVSEAITTEGVTLTTRQEYSLQGRTLTTVYPDGFRLEHAYDGASVAVGHAGILSDATYDANGALTGYRFVNGVAVAMPRDPASQRLAQSAARRGDTTLRSLDYAYDPVGNIVSIRDEIAGDVELSEHTYDGLHRLVRCTRRRDSAAGAVLHHGAYDYDASGNILAFEEVQPLALRYEDAAHPGRTTAVVGPGGAQPIGYDARGHMRAFGVLESLEFDALDRLVRARKADGTELRFVHDAQNRRLLKRVTRNGVTSTIRYAGALYEDHEDHALRHIHFGGTRVATINVPRNATPSRAVYYLCDRHGTLLLATDDTGEVVQQQRYTPFGAARNAGGSLDSYLGRDRDVETGLQLLGARYYAPTIGRFISPDWFVLESPHRPARVPQAFNVYSYAINNPLLFKDPSGLWFFIGLAVAFAVGFVVGTIYGLATGQGLGQSLLTGLEAGLLASAGFALGWGAGYALGAGAAWAGIGWFPSAATLAGVGAISAGVNGTLSGMHGIYDWKSWTGYAAFLSDSTWGLLGTSLGNIVQIINIAIGAKYNDSLSRRQNRNLYEGGIYVQKADAFTLGNVTSNAAAGGTTLDMDLLNKHEALHILQNRIFGPIMQATYIVWAVGGLIVGSVAKLFNWDHSWSDLVETAVYYDNPFEYWAYSNQGYWQPKGEKGFDPIIAWG